MIATVTLNPSLDEWIHLPTLRLGSLNRASTLMRYPGGKGINVSRVIQELGGRTTAFAVAGGEDGLILRERMNRLSIRHEFVAIGGSTRNNYKIRTASPDALTEINTAGPTVSLSALRQLQHRLLRQASSLRCVVLSGSLPPGVQDSIYRRWIRLFHHRGIPTVLDASGAAFRDGLTAHPWLIKPNREEAEEILRQRLTRRSALIRAVRQLTARGAAIAILSLGRDGALMAVAASQQVWWARPPAVKTDSAVGAGDSLVGGFLVGWRRGVSLPAAFQLGVACGTATAMTPGTELCHRADVRRLLSRVRLQRLA